MLMLMVFTATSITLSTSALPRPVSNSPLIRALGGASARAGRRLGPGRASAQGRAGRCGRAGLRQTPCGTAGAEVTDAARRLARTGPDTGAGDGHRQLTTAKWSALPCRGLDLQQQSA